MYTIADNNRAFDKSNFDEWLRGNSVLLVDSSREDAAKYQSWLVDAGATVTTAFHFEHGVELIARNIQEYDIAIFGEATLSESVVLLAEQVKAHHADCALLIYCMDAAPELILRIRRLGAGFLSKAAGQADFMFATSKLAEGEIPDVEVLVARAQRRWQLSRQQSRLLYYNLWSCSNREIARSLGVSLNTVQEYQQKLRRKTGARTKDGYLRLLLECAGRTPPGVPAKTGT